MGRTGMPINDLTVMRCCVCTTGMEDLTGERFGRLVVLSYSHADTHYNHYWNTVCDCGNMQAIYSGHLKSGHTRSCGCLKIEEVSDSCKKRIGPLNPRWNNNLTDEERRIKRNFPEYKEWRTAVYERDGYACQKCGDYTGGNLIAHHIEGYSDNPELRIELSNGVTLCENCHKDYHHMYGNHATREKFNEWIYKGILCRIEIVMEKAQQVKARRLAEV